MKVHSINHSDLINYPDHICSVIATQGCNEACEYCHNKELLGNTHPSAMEVSPKDLVRMLVNNPHCRSRYVTITGGEPMMQPDLYKVMSLLTHEKFSIKLDTNSTFKSLLGFTKHLSYVALDVKHYEQEHLMINISVLLHKRIPFELRCTVYNQDSIRNLYEAVKAISTISYMFRIRTRQIVPVYFQVETTGVGFSKERVEQSYNWFKDQNIKYVDIRMR